MPGLFRVGAPFGFTPLSVAGCTMWCRADLGVTLNSGNVSTWADQSGAGRNLTQATGANQPLYVASGFNSKPTIRFDGTTSKMVGVAMSNLITFTTGTLFFVLKLITQPTLDSSIVYGNDSIFSDSGADFGMSVRRTTLGVRSYNYTGSYQETSPDVTVAVGTPVILKWQHSAGNIICRSNANTAVSVASGSSSTLSNAIQIASCQDIRYLNADISEIIAYNTAPSATDETSVRNYLNSRYAIF